jgi:hypothetical protein
VYSEKYATISNMYHYRMTSGKSLVDTTGYRNVRSLQISKQHHLGLPAD